MIGSRELQCGAQGLPGTGYLRGSRESHWEPAACVTAAKETWAEQGATVAKPPLHIKEALRGSTSGLEHCKQGMARQFAVQFMWKGV